MKAFICDDEKVIHDTDNKEFALSELVIVPPFLRFGTVWLEYRLGFQSIAQKCELYRGYLSSIKAALYDSNITKFYCKIHEEDPSQFNNHLTFLEHIREIVSICDSSRGYKFGFDIQTNSSASWNTNVWNLISSILEMPAISRSSSVYIYHYHPYNDNITVTQLLIEKISTWLNRERRAMDQNQRERTLWLDCSVKVAQFQEMCDFLKQVSFPKIKPFSFEFAI